MAADQERADRVRALKQERPDLTWRRIGDYVGVSERAAIDWQKRGGMDYANAEKLAELFEVDVDYIWRGTTNGDTPDPFAGAGDGDVDQQLAHILQRIEDLHARLDALTPLLPGVESILSQARAETQPRRRRAG